MSTIPIKASMPENQRQNKVKQRSSQYRFLLMLLAFALPVVLAKLALHYNWLDYGVTNKGQLFEQPLTLKQLNLNDSAIKKQWLLLLALPQSCQQHCQESVEASHALQTIQNTFTALGKDKARVSTVALGKQPRNMSSALSQDWLFIKNSEKSARYFNVPQLIIVDPLGNLVLFHPLPEESSTMPFFGKQVLADMKKLLKYSKVG